MLKNLRNNLDFYLRRKFSFSRAISPATPMHPKAVIMQSEILEFLRLFKWPLYLNKKSLTIADVGARTFSFAPAIEKNFSQNMFDTEIHGYEIDAYRRFTNFHTRADYGHYYAQKIKTGFFHEEDFLKSNKNFDVILMLHPFVTKAPHIAWGLPLHTFAPERLFEHSAALLEAQKGLMLLSSPGKEELATALELALRFNLTPLERHDWLPEEKSLQRQPRFGCLLRGSPTNPGI